MSFLSRSYSDDTFFIYLHIQKAAGMTMQKILRRVFHGNRRIFQERLGRFIFSRPSLDLQNSLQSKEMADRFFQGHCCFGVHRYLPSPATYMTMLRHPLKRLISLYYYSVNNPTAYYHEHAQGKSLEAFLLDTELMELDNGMTRFVAGDENDLFINRTAIGECGPNLLEQAKQNLERAFCFVGTTEQFNKSIFSLAGILGKSHKHFFYIRENVGKENSRKRIKLSDSTVNKILDKNKLDLELYSYAENLLDDSFQNVLAIMNISLYQFEEELRDYQRRWQGIHKVSVHLRSRFKKAP